MKKLYVLISVLSVMCICCTAVFLIVAPDTVPVHWNFAGEVDRMGSKYENLIFPALALLLGVFFAFMAKKESKKSEKSNEKPVLITGVCSIALFTVISFYFMIKSAKYEPGTPSGASAGDINRFVNIAIGALLAVLGNIMPKVRRNSFVGIRTKWSLANDTVWQKSQRFGGIVSVITGLLLIVLSLFVPGMWNILLSGAAITAVVILCTAASYRYYKEYKGEENTNE
ncbi:MAG: SdpI family protein [Clostridia bacterium]|nr:SdpI family protein [Clostridia bacterium]